MAFSFYILCFPVIYSPFDAFCWSVMNGVVYGLPMRACQHQVRFQKLIPGCVAGGKCKLTFAFHIQFFPVTYLTFAVFYSSVMNGAGYDVPVGMCHYEVSFEGLPGSCRRKAWNGFSFHIWFFPVTDSIFVVFSWSVVKGVEGYLSMTAFQYKSFCRWWIVLIEC